MLEKHLGCPSVSWTLKEEQVDSSGAELSGQASGSPEISGETSGLLVSVDSPQGFLTLVGKLPALRSVGSHQGFLEKYLA